jgi:hypothetical protein
MGFARVRTSTTGCKRALLEDSGEGDRPLRREADHGSGRKPIRRRSEATLALRLLPRLIGIIKWNLSGAKRRPSGRGEDGCGARGSSPSPRLSTQCPRSANSDPVETRDITFRVDGFECVDQLALPLDTQSSWFRQIQRGCPRFGCEPMSSRALSALGGATIFRAASPFQLPPHPGR